MVLSSYICSIVLVELKLLQVICNRYVGLEPKRGGEILPIAAGKNRCERTNILI